MANKKVGEELRRFFTDLIVETNFTAYHDDAEGYVRKQQEKGVVGNAASRLILDEKRGEIEENLNAAPLRIVFPPT